MIGPLFIIERDALKAMLNGLGTIEAVKRDTKWNFTFVDSIVSRYNYGCKSICLFCKILI